VAELADRVVVMYAGRVVELGDVYTIFNSPRHPYTVGLMNSLARLDADLEWLQPIPGQPPSLISPPPGCAFHPRCTFSNGRAICRTDVPELRNIGGATHLSRCHFAEELEARHVTAGVAAGDEA
jgi:oligopeptide/dipeptide ABC transporter ATP-binding protein